MLKIAVQHQRARSLWNQDCGAALADGPHIRVASRAILLQYFLIGLLIEMRTASRRTRSFSLDHEILAEVKRTRGTLSQSERVNRLLRLALDLERRAALERETASFYGSAPTNRTERRAFESATIESLARD